MNALTLIKLSMISIKARECSFLAMQQVAVAKSIGKSYHIQLLNRYYKPIVHWKSAKAS